MPTATNRCTGCKERFKAETMIRINAGKFHSVDCATSYATAKSAKLREKARKEKIKAQKKQDRETKERHKTRRDYIKDLKTIFNTFIRLRDHDQPCISCGRHDHEIEDKYTGGKWDAGHFCSVGAHVEKRFMEENVHKQCKHCNSQTGLGGNYVNYRKGLIERLGIEAVERIEGPARPPKMTADELKAAIQHYKAKVRQLKKQIEGRA